MSDFPIQYIILFILELLAAIIATITYKKYRHTPSQYFLYLLWFTIFIELMAQMIFLNAKDHFNYGESWLVGVFNNILPVDYLKFNNWLFNILSIVTYTFYLLYFLLLVKAEKFKKTIKLFVFLFILIIIYCFSDFQHFNKGYYYLVESTGPLFLFVAATFYFIDILKSDEILVFYKRLPFWITSGALIFYLTIAPMFIFSNQLRKSNEITDQILFSVNIILYSFFIIGFLIIPKPKK